MSTTGPARSWAPVTAPHGWRDDDLAFVMPWGFEVGEIDVPVAVWHGKQDRAVPFTHGRWLVDHVPGARGFLTDDQGHLSLIARPDLLLDELLEIAD